jgi:hypothetical protein
MKLKYRIQKIKFPDEQPIYIAQYRILGIWINMGPDHGHFQKDGCTHCPTILQAKDMIKKHKELMSRSGKWCQKEVTIVHTE